MKLFFAFLVLTAAIVGCRHHRDGRNANDPSSRQDADAGVNEYAPLPRPESPESRPESPAPTVTAQPGDVQL